MGIVVAARSLTHGPIMLSAVQNKRWSLPLRVSSLRIRQETTARQGQWRKPKETISHYWSA